MTSQITMKEKAKSQICGNQWKKEEDKGLKKKKALKKGFPIGERFV